MSARDIEGLVAQIVADVETVQWYDRPLPWVVHTGSSYRRIASEATRENLRSFPDGNVLHAQRHNDGCMDLSMGERELEALVRIVNSAPEAATALLALKAENDGLRAGLMPTPAAIAFALPLTNEPDAEDWRIGDEACEMLGCVNTDGELAAAQLCRDYRNVAEFLHRAILRGSGEAG